MYYLTAESTLLLGLFIACTGGAIIAFAVWRRIRRERRKKSRKCRESLSILHFAMSSRAQFDVHIENSKGQPVHTFRGTCLAATPKELTLVLEKDGPAQEWTAIKVHLYFRFVQNGIMRFFDCYTAVSAAEKLEGHTRLVLPLPLDFGNQQRRSFVRYEPSEGFTKSVSLWFGNITGENVQSAPAIQWQPVPAAQVRVLDLAAGGMRLLLPSSLGDARHLLETGNLFLVQFTLEEPSIAVSSSPASAALASSSASLSGAPRNVLQDTASQSAFSPKAEPQDPPVTVAAVAKSLRVSTGPTGVEVGLRFSRWAQVLPGQKTVWMPINDNEGISPLGSWVMRRLSEQMRKLGSAAQRGEEFTLRLDSEEDD